MRTKIRAAFCIRLSTSENCGTGTDITTCLLLLLLHSTYSWRFEHDRYRYLVVDRLYIRTKLFRVPAGRRDGPVNANSRMNI